MLIPTSNFLNIEVDNKTGQNINSIKIDYSKMVFLPQTSHPFTQCKYCSALLTQEVSVLLVRTLKMIRKAIAKTSAYGSVDFAKDRMLANKSILSTTTINSQYKRIVINL